MIRPSHVLKRAFTLTAVSLFASQASAWWFSQPEYGYSISAATGQATYQVGQTASFSGQINVLFSHDDFDDDFGRGHYDFFGDGNRWTRGALNGAEVKFFFPDESTDVTSQVSFDSRRLTFRFTTPALSGQGLNSLIVKIRKPATARIQNLERVKGKLDRRVSDLNALIARLQTQASSHALEPLIDLRDKLQVVSGQVAVLLTQDLSQLAQAKIPLQVGNSIAAPGYQMSLLSGFRFELTATPGSAIQGESVQVDSTITNLRNQFTDVIWDNPCKDADTFTIKLLWNGTAQKTLTNQKLPVAGLVTASFTKTGLGAGTNAIALSLAQVTQSRFRTTTTNFGEIALSLPVARDNLSPVWSLVSPFGNSMGQLHYVQQTPALDATLADMFGLVDRTSLTAKVTGNPILGGSLLKDLTPSLVLSSQNNDASVRMQGTIEPLNEGIYTLSLLGKDLAGNLSVPSPFSVNFRVDRTAPQITLGITTPILTSSPTLSLPVTVTDLSPTVTSVSLNGTQVNQSTALSFTVLLALAEGPNFISTNTTDEAGNSSNQSLNNVILDTTPPLITLTSPVQNAAFGITSIPISGSANEALSQASVNGTPLTLSADQRGFSGSFNLMIEGPAHLAFIFSDLVGNTTTVTRDITVSLKALNAALISAVQDPDGVHVDIVGAQGAVRPGLTVNAQGSFLNKGQATAGSDGSFMIVLSPFTSAQVTVFNPTSNKTESASINFGQGSTTVLSGVVRSTDDSPIIGATVKISGTTQSTTTDNQGIFTFTSAASGDQDLIIDGGTSVQLPPPAPQVRFSQVTVGITIGLGQSNVLNRPIYLNPIPKDGSTTVISTAGGSVFSSHAPGVSLSIPNGAITVPQGSNGIEISLATVSSARSTIAPPSYAMPQSVVALEPSGLKFNSRVSLTIPNYNLLPAGVKLVVISMNSTTGRWEADGLATVDSSGATVTTDPGAGISHFSVVYMSPLGPKPATFGDQDRPGADTFNGALVRHIQMPSYKALGQSIAPSLTYKSSWAKPTVLVTNLFDIPKQTVSASFSGNGSLLGITNQEVTVTQTAWFQPNYITAQFFTTGIVSDSDPTTPGAQPMKFTGVPNKAAISFSMDLTGLNSGVYPYTSHYEVNLEQMVLTTRSTRSWGWFSRSSVQEDPPSLSSTILDQLFPTDLTGNIYLQNYTQSDAGTGWRINGVERIVNPSDNLLSLEEGDGSISGYAVNNTINTLWWNSGTTVDLNRGVDLSQFPQVKLSANTGKLYSADLTGVVSGNPRLSLVSSPITMSGKLAGTAFYSTLGDGGATFAYYYVYSSNYSIGPFAQSLLTLTDGRVVGTDSNREMVFIANSANGSELYLAGKNQSSPPTFNFSSGNPNDISPVPGLMTAYCTATSGMNCQSISSPAFNTCDGFTNPSIQVCNGGSSSGLVPVKDFNGDGAVGSTVALNQPMGLSAGPRPNTIVFADTGNHRVRLIDLSTNQIITVAGNGVADEVGDGVQATQAAIRNPQGVVYDSGGNLYISTRVGSIRKVTPSGVISFLVGGPGSTPGDNLFGTQVLLNNPYGLAVDNNNGYLYIAETGAHKIRRVDLASGIVSTVAGGESPGLAGDGGPALFAQLNSPTQIAIDPDQNLLIVDAGNQRIRKVVFENTSGNQIVFRPRAQDGSVLAKNTDGSFTRTLRNGTVRSYDNTGREVSSVDRVGHTLSYTYSSGHLAQVTDPSGQSIQYFYAGARLDHILDPAGRTTVFSYDSFGNLQNVTFPDHSKRTFTYDNSRMISETNERGYPTIFAYNDWGRISSITNAKNQTLVINDLGSATAANNFDGVNQTGTLQSLTDGIVKNTVTDPRSATTSFKPDLTGTIQLITDAQGMVNRFDRNNRGQPVKIYKNFKDGGTPTDSSDDTWDSTVTFVYNGSGDLLSQMDSATGITTSQTYNSYGQILSETNEKGVTTTHTLDPVTGLETGTSNSALGQLGTVEYNGPFHQKSKITNSTGGSTTYSYFANGNLNQTSTVINGTQISLTSFGLDSAGNVLTVTNANSQTTTYEYDAWNRLSAVVDPTQNRSRTEYSYTETGKLKQIKDAELKNVTYEYNELDQLTKKTDQLGLVTSFDHDENGNLIMQKDPNGNTISYAYDLKNRLTQKTLPDDVYTYTYNAQGGITLASNGATSITYDYDGQNKKVIGEHSRGLGAFSYLPSSDLIYSYDAFEVLQTVVDSVGTTTYGFDNLNRLTSIKNAYGEAFTFGYDSGSRLNSISRPGSNTSVSFDVSSFVSQISHTKASGGAPIDQFGYGRDHLGNRTQINRTLGGNISLTYDENQQLKSLNSTTSETPSESYTYDEIYNRSTDQGGSYAYDLTKQRLTEDYRSFYFYDSNGNLISKQAKGMTGEVVQFAYTSENQLLSAKFFEPGSAQNLLYSAGTSTPVKEVAYVYDALGRRVEKRFTHRQDTTQSFTRRYAYDGQNLISEYDENNNLLAHYTHNLQGSSVTDDVLSVMVTSQGVQKGLAQVSGSYQYIKDAQGSVIEVTTNQGSVVQRYVYAAFGAILGVKDASANDVTATAPIRTAFTFTGREADSETGLYYYRARYYDPVLGRFIQQDGSPGVSGSPSSVVNRYIYGANNSFSNTDPTGNSILGDIFNFVLSVSSVFTAGLATYLIDPDFARKVTLAAWFGAVTGGAGLGAGSLVGGGWAGAGVGAVAGGLAGGAFNVVTGQGTFWGGFIAGAIVGGLAGFSAGEGDGSRVEVADTNDDNAKRIAIELQKSKIRTACYNKSAATVGGSAIASYYFAASYVSAASTLATGPFGLPIAGFAYGSATVATAITFVGGILACW